MPDNAPRVLIVGSSFGFPYGQGAASRAYMYAKALQHAGAEVRVVSLVKPSLGDDEEGEAVSGVYEGIPHEYACGTRLRPSSFLGRRLLGVRLVLRTYRLIASSSREARGRCVVLIYSGAAEWIAALTVMARMSSAVAVLDLCEYPLVKHTHSFKGLVLRETRRAILYPALDGIITISTYLDQYVAAGRRPPARLLVPVMVDSDAFDASPSASRTSGRHVVYCGALGRSDEVTRAVRSFAEIAEDFPEADLILIGYGPPAREAQIKALVRELGLEKRVRFTGDVRREELPRLFAAAEVFVLPRPAGVFSIAGLPNKLGEYLAAARPVVVNANGDIPRYLEHDVSAYLVDPHDEELFTFRLRYALEHRDEAAAVGARGRAVAVREFDYRRHGARLVDFFSSLLARRTNRDDA